MSHGGSGVGRHEDFVFFVPFTAPGDLIEAEVVETKKNYGDAICLSILEPSSHRTVPKCPAFGTCGGCQWQHVNYTEQLHQKQLMIHHAISRIAKEESVSIPSVIPSESPFEYRNRAQLRMKDGEVGFFRRKSNEIVDINHCYLLEPPLQQELEALRRLETEKPHKSIHKVEIFLDKKGQVVRTENRNHSEDTGFSQINTKQNAVLIEHVKQALGPPKPGRNHLLDLYCGNGNFSFPLNEVGWDVYGVDLSKAAIHEARQNSNSLTFFSCSDAIWETQKLAKRGRTFNAVLLDPPRIGAGESLWPALEKLEPEVIIYISCNPSTFSRDWARLKKAGPYKLHSLQGFDMFPQTFHVELMAVAHRINNCK
ncbi:MAG: class I SAM-dependent RNA methyltransferase [Oligoflexia bacterium]|nr:class I SAM-dependent RNA methyltransferase [Oligoflexia bacterium]